ncbi:hypothetical protein F8M41_012075 [Gigaspora margarita]|uniref:Uncharacterized protein n=1 Tax=Gigaspora margarita TaxID=4874 RepID=A0A8H4AT88_GIGMA|nr:hypothetical protein F8M41_012075 [Gigaspora margarita]
MPQNNLSINIHTFSTEQRCQFFLELFDLDPTLPNALNYEQRRRLHSVLIAIEPSLAESLLDPRSAVRGIANKQFPRGSTMNPIKLSEYENYKESQKRIKKDFNEVNSTFLVSEADFVLRDWLTSYCNSMEKKKTIEAREKGYALPPKKKNVQPPIRRRNTNYIDVESTSDQSDTDEISDNAQDLFECHDNINDNMDESVEPNVLTPTSSASSHANIGQKNNMPKRKNSAALQPYSTNIKVNDHSTNIKVNDHKLSTVVLENSQNNTNDEPDTLTTTTSTFSHADIGQKNTSKLIKNKPKKRNTVPMRPHSTNIKVNIYQNARNLENNEDGQDDTNENTLEPDALTTANNVLHADIGQENISTLVKNKLKKKNLTPMQPHNTNIKVNNHQNAKNLENDEQSTVILEDNVLPLLRKSLRSSAQKFNNIETISEIIKDDVQDSGKKRKREQKAKKTSSHSARAGKKTKN